MQGPPTVARLLATAIPVERQMNKTEIATACADSRTAASEAASEAAGKLAAARAALGLMGRRARDASARAQAFAERAPRRARQEIVRRRTDAAERLESLAGVIRPIDESRARSRRKTLAVAGGSTLALTAALGAGVALGMFISRQLQKRRAEQPPTESVADAAQPPARTAADPTAFADVSGLPH